MEIIQVKTNKDGSRTVKVNLTLNIQIYNLNDGIIDEDYMKNIINEYKRGDLGKLVLNSVADYSNKPNSKSTPTNTSCEDCGSNRAKERSFSLGADGGLKGYYCEKCWIDICYELAE